MRAQSMMDMQGIQRELELPRTLNLKADIQQCHRVNATRQGKGDPITGFNMMGKTSRQCRDQRRCMISVWQFP